MRFIPTILLLLIVTACVKKQQVVNRLEGEWSLTKYLNQDGSYTYFTGITYTFQGGDADGETYLNMTFKNDTVTSEGKYLVDKKGEKLFLMPDANHTDHIDTLTIEDIDKNSFVGRAPGYVWFLEKK